nr:MAG TPA: hypothetical protein [Caudoviricetes sp.]
MKNRRRNDEWFYITITKIFVSVPVIGAEWMIVKAWTFLLNVLQAWFFKVIISIPAFILFLSLAIILFEVWCGDFTDYY